MNLHWYFIANSCRALALAALMVGAALPISGAAEGKDPTITVTYPGKDWVMRLTVPDLIEEYNNHKTGISSYFSGFSVASEIIVSAELIAAAPATSAGECRDRFYNAIKDRPGIGDFKFSEVNGVPRYETFNAEVKGIPLRQKHVHAVYLRDGVCAKIHVSKVKFEPEHEKLLEAVLASVRFEPVNVAQAITRSFIVSGATAISMKMPITWGFRKEVPRKGMPLGMYIHEPADDFQMGIRLIDADGIPGTRDDAFLQSFVEGAKNRMLPSATETTASVERLAGRSGNAFFYQVTNKTPLAQQEKGVEWRYLYQGATSLNDLLVIFTIYSNQKSSPDVVAAFDLIKDLQRELWRNP